MKKNQASKTIAIILAFVVITLSISGLVMAQVGGGAGQESGTPGQELPPDPENQGGAGPSDPLQPAPENTTYNDSGTIIDTGNQQPTGTSPGGTGNGSTYTPPTYDPNAFDVTPDTYTPPTYTPPAQPPDGGQPPAAGASCGNGICEAGEATTCAADCQTAPPTGPPSQPPGTNEPPTGQPQGQGIEGITAMLDKTVPGGTIAIAGVIVILIAIAGIFIYKKVNAVQ